MTICVEIPIHPIALILGIVFIVDLVLAYRIWINNPRHLVNICFGLSVLMAAFWALAMLGLNVLPVSSFLFSISVRLSYVAAALIAFFFWWFTYHFPYKVYNLSKTGQFLLFFGVLFVLFMSIWPDLFLIWNVAPRQRFKPEISLFCHLIYACYFLTVMILSFYNLFLKYKNSSGIWHKRVKQVIIATSVATIGGTIFSLIIPIIYNDVLVWVGSLFTVFMAGYIWYNVFWKVRKNFDI